jgi:phosphoesterase RecJ-like protein
MSSRESTGGENLKWAPFAAFAQKHQRFLVTTHTRPDGDALGSMLALAEALEAIGKTVHRVIASRMPPRYAFMDPDGRVEVFREPAGGHLRACDAIVVVDTGTWNQLAGLAEFVRQSSAATFVIDHHRTQDDLRGYRIVDPESESCGRLIAEAVEFLGCELMTPSMAHNLFIAVATDTGWFRHSNTSPATFALAERLMAAGARPTEAYERIYETTSLSRLRLLGLVLERLKTACGGRLAYSEVHAGDYAATGAIPPDTEDLINSPRSVADVELAIMFMEQPEGGIKVSFRSRESVDVSALAEQFGGGGHRRAAGATVNTSLAEARDRVLAAARSALAKP